MCTEDKIVNSGENEIVTCELPVLLVSNWFNIWEKDKCNGYHEQYLKGYTNISNQAIQAIDHGINCSFLVLDLLLYLWFFT